MCVSKLCVSKLCVSKLCVDKLCVEEAAGGGDGRAGVHNQKQEPHTKLWGKKIPTRLFGRGGFPAKTLFFCFSMFLGFGHFQPCAPICLEIGLLTALRAHGLTGTRARGRFTGTRAHEESTGTRAHGHTRNPRAHGHTGTLAVQRPTGTPAHEQSTDTQAQESKKLR